MFTLKQLITVLAISTVGSRCVVALPQNSGPENMTPNVPQINEVDPLELPHADDDEDSHFLDVSGFKKGFRGFGYPY
ncbi:hypothetical protein HK102_002051 [Quaeritorhiza haematococci]|nr:hypothetical protein HK102_002051 [Quaeritorhiza haematococci]